MDPNSVCRLCGRDEDLIAVFDDQVEFGKVEDLRLLIFKETEVDIREDDVVSKMICKRCRAVVFKLQEYRKKAVDNDKRLKEQCGQPYAAPTTDHNELRRLGAQILTGNGETSVTPLAALSHGRLLLVDTKNTIANCDILKLFNYCVKQEPVDNSPQPKQEPSKHDSVKELYRLYSHILLPESVYKCHIAPVVTLDRNEVIVWVEEKFKRVQQKLSLAKTTIHKVDKSCTNDKHIKITENELQVNNTLQSKKQSDPKSKTLDIVIPPPIPSSVVQIKIRPRLKSKTIDRLSNSTGIELKEKLFNDVSIYSKPGPESLNAVLYGSGPMSRKADLIISSTTVKTLVRQCQTIKTIEEPPPKLMKLQQKSNKVVEIKEDSNKVPESKSKVSGSSQPTMVNHIPSDNVERDNVSDNEDFDSSNLFMQDDFFPDLSSSEEIKLSEATKIRNSKKHKVNNSITELHSEPSTKCISSTRSDDSNNDFFEISKTRSVKKSDKSETRKRKRPLSSYKHVSSVESGKSDESVKKRKTNSNSENDNKLDSKIKNGQFELSTKSAKSDITNSANHKPNTNKNIGQDHLFKKNKFVTIKSPVTDKKESTKLDNKELQRFSMNDKQEPDKREIVKQKSDKRKPTKVAMNTSTLQKRNNDPPSLLVGRTQKIFMCHKCCKLCDTNKELIDHLKQHLICQFCNYRMKNLETLMKHQKNNCPMSIHRSQPTVKLIKVDTIKSIVSRYPKAFDNESDNTTAVSNATVHQDLPGQSVIPVPPLLNPSEIKSEIICVSDESDDDIECTDVLYEKKLLSKSILELPLTSMTENQLIQSVFTAHVTAVLKLRRASQTFLPHATDITYTNSNLIVLENLSNALYTYKIPVELDIRPKISAHFTTQLVVTPPVDQKFECWAHSTVIVICKPINKTALSSRKHNWIAPTKFNSQSLAVRASGKAVPDNSPLINTNVAGSSKCMPSLSPVQSTVAFSNLSRTNSKTTECSKYNGSVMPTTQPHAAPSCNTNISVVESNKFQLSSPVLPTTQALIVTSNSPQINTNTLLLNNLLNSSPSVPTSPQLLTNSNVILSTNNSFLPSDKNPPSLVSLLATSSVSTTNVTTTLIHTLNNGTLLMQNGISPNSTTIIQTPNNATLIQTPNAAVIQTGGPMAFATPDSTLEMVQSNVSLTTNSITMPVSSQSSLVLMQTVPQVPNQATIGEQASINAINSNNLLLQSPAEQIYQINNVATNLNKVVVLSNTLANNLPQNMPLYDTSSLSNFQSLQFEPSSVSIKEIEDKPHKNGNASNADVTTNQNKSSTLRIKPNWELY